MNKLTTINTIKKAAPLALLAVVMSGSAFAGNGNGKGKGPRVQGAKLSVAVNTTCELVPRAGAEYDDFEDPVLLVTTVVDASDSGDNGIGAPPTGSSSSADNATPSDTVVLRLLKSRDTLALAPRCR